MEPVLADDTIDDACAVLTMVAQFHKQAIAPSMVQQILHRVSEEPGGRTALDLVRGAAELGLRARGLHLDYGTQIQALSFPCVAHVSKERERPEDGHFVLIERIYLQWKELSIIDPYAGPRREPVDQFALRASGVFIVFEPGHQIPRAVLKVRR